MGKIYRVSPDEKNPTHDVLLTDGKRTLGLIIADSEGNHTPLNIVRAPVSRTALKTASGSQEYTDMEPPWSSIVQKDWSGGRGKADFEDDTTKFFDSWAANTYTGRIFNGPQLQIGDTGSAQGYYNWPGNMNWLSVMGANTFMTTFFTAATAKGVALTSCLLYLRRRGTPANNLTVTLHLESDDSVLATATVTTTNISDILSVLYDVALTYTVTNATLYYIGVTSPGGTSNNCWQIGAKATSVDTDWTSMTNNNDWFQHKYQLYYHLHTGNGNREAIKRKYTQYRQVLYELRYDGTNTKLYYNGDFGVADSNSGHLNQLIDASKSWTTNEWAGCIVKVIYGPGAEETRNWRVIASNTSTVITVTENWNVAHTTDSMYVILGSNKWTMDTVWDTAGDGKQFIDVKNVNGLALWVTFGDEDEMVIYRWRDDDEGLDVEIHLDAGDGTFLCSVGDKLLWRSKNYYLNNTDPTDYLFYTDPIFSDDYHLHDDYGKVTNLIAYGQDYKSLYILREGMLQNVYYSDIESDWVISDIMLPEIGTWMERTNGIAAVHHNAYLYFSYGNGVERYSNGQLEDVGPNRDEGLPANRQGYVSSLISYPGKIFGVVDAGATGYSSIMISNGTDWHELYRAPYGVKIYDIKYQTIPGSGMIDRLWVAEGKRTFWLPMPSYSTDPTKDPNYLFTHECAVETGYMYANMYDVWKVFYALTLFCETLAEDAQEIEVDYKIDDDTSWTTMDIPFNETPIQEQQLSDSLLVARRIRFRYRLITNDATKTAKIKATVIESIGRVKTKYAYSFPYRLSDDDVDLLGEPEEYTAAERQDMMDEWAEELVPLKQFAVKRVAHNKLVFTDPQTVRPTRENSEGYSGNAITTELIKPRKL